VHSNLALAEEKTGEGGATPTTDLECTRNSVALAFALHSYTIQKALPVIAMHRYQNAIRAKLVPPRPRRYLLDRPELSTRLLEEFLTAALLEKMGDDRYPGDSVPSPNWPNAAPGVWGPINAGSPKYPQGDVPALLAVEPKPAEFNAILHAFLGQS
jgi:hypothetical protein